MKRILLILALLLLVPTVAEAGWRYRYYGGYRPYYRPYVYAPVVPYGGAYYTGYGPRYYARPVYVAPPPVFVAPRVYGYGPYGW